MNLVVGASGLLGTEICRKLLQEGKQLRALVRSSTDPAKQDRLKGLGARLAYGDLKDLVTLEAACRGISTVISTASSTFSRQQDDSIESVDSRGQLSLVQAAKAAGVDHFIFISFPPHRWTLLCKGPSELWRERLWRAELRIQSCNPRSSPKCG